MRANDGDDDRVLHRVLGPTRLGRHARLVSAGAVFYRKRFNAFEVFITDSA